MFATFEASINEEPLCPQVIVSFQRWISKFRMNLSDFGESWSERWGYMRGGGEGGVWNPIWPHSLCTGVIPSFYMRRVDGLSCSQHTSKVWVPGWVGQECWEVDLGFCSKLMLRKRLRAVVWRVFFLFFSFGKVWIFVVGSLSYFWSVVGCVSVLHHVVWPLWWWVPRTTFV